MIVIWIILILLLIFLIWLLLAPISLNIDSKIGKYLIRWRGIGTVALITATEEWFLKLKIGFWEKKIFMSSFIEKVKEKEEMKIETPKKKKRSNNSFVKYFRKIRQVLKSFKVKVCKINLDTDDYYWNALLIPVFQLVNRGNRHRIAINFRNENDILLIVENRLLKILYSILR